MAYYLWLLLVTATATAAYCVHLLLVTGLLRVPALLRVVGYSALYQYTLRPLTDTALSYVFGLDATVVVARLHALSVIVEGYCSRSLPTPLHYQYSLFASEFNSLFEAFNSGSSTGTSGGSGVSVSALYGVYNALSMSALLVWSHLTHHACCALTAGGATAAVLGRAVRRSAAVTTTRARKRS